MPKSIKTTQVLDQMMKATSKEQPCWSTPNIMLKASRRAISRWHCSFRLNAQDITEFLTSICHATNVDNSIDPLIAAPLLEAVIAIERIEETRGSGIETSARTEYAIIGACTRACRPINVIFTLKAVQGFYFTYKTHHAYDRGLYSRYDRAGHTFEPLHIMFLNTPLQGTHL